MCRVASFLRSPTVRESYGYAQLSLNNSARAARFSTPSGSRVYLLSNHARIRILHKKTEDQHSTMNITVLGTGLVGSAMVKELAAEPSYAITAVDINLQTLEELAAVAPVRTVQADLRDPDRIADLVTASDLVISAVPGHMGFQTLQAIIEAGKNVVDISFFSEDPFSLDHLAHAKEVTAVVDCGVAPGLCNLILGAVERQFDHIARYVCYVGGLPVLRQWPYEYKAVFSPSDVLEEYTRPARQVACGQVVVRPALSEVELIDLPGVGTLEAFNTDGLRTLIRTMEIPFMQEKTLRYPGHANLMRALRETGFFVKDPIEVDGTSVRPLALTSRLLFDQWRLAEGEEDFTVMQVRIEGQREGKPVHMTYNLLDRYDRETKTTSMARTTGYTATAVARQVLQGLYTQKGISPPEFVGRTPGCFEDLIARLAAHKIHLQVSTDD